MKFYIENKLSFMFIYWSNLCQRFWGILSRYQLSHAYLSSIRSFTPVPECELQVWECMRVSAAYQHLSNRAQTLDILWRAFFYNTSVNFSPRRYKEGKSTDINSDELCSSAHLKKSIYGVTWVEKYLIVHLLGNCWSVVDSLESTLAPERCPHWKLWTERGCIGEYAFISRLADEKENRR